MRSNLKWLVVLLIFQSCSYPLVNEYKLLQEKKYIEAKEQFTGKINSTKLNKKKWRYDGFLGRGICNNQLGDNISANADYDSCIKILPKVDYAYCNKSISLSEMGKPDEALDEVNIALQNYAYNSLTCYQRARMFVYFKNYQGALEDLLIAIKLWNKGATECKVNCPLNLRAMIYQKMGEPSKALPDYIRAGNKSKDYVLMNYNQALCYLQMNDTANAKLALERTITLDKKATVESAFAQMQMQKLTGNKVDVALAEERISKSSKKEFEKKYALACLHAIEGDTEKSVKYLSDCMRENRSPFCNMLLDYQLTEVAKQYNLNTLYVSGGEYVVKNTGY